MRLNVRGVGNCLDRLSDAVDAMRRETVSCRRNLMVFRARMDATERKVASIQQTLHKTMAVLEEAEADARRAADIFRATAAGRSAG